MLAVLSFPISFPLAVAGVRRAFECEQSVCCLTDISSCVRKLLIEMAKINYSSNDQNAVRLALTEALTNAIQHGHHEDFNKSVQVRYSVFPDVVRIEVIDQGEGFDFASISGSPAPGRLSVFRGRGLFLMRSAMDEVEFEPGGSRVRMTKRKSGILAQAGLSWGSPRQF